MKLRLAILGWLLLWVAPAFGQGCAMCYSSAAGTTKEGQIAIGRGVMVLIAPPVGLMMFGGGFAVLYGRKRDREQD